MHPRNTFSCLLHSPPVFSISTRLSEQVITLCSLLTFSPLIRFSCRGIVCSMQSAAQQPPLWPYPTTCTHERTHTHTGTSQMLRMSFWSLFVCCCCREYRQKLNHILKKSHLGIICFIPNARKLPLSRLAHSQQWFPPTHLSQHDFPKVERGDRDDAAFSWHSSNIFLSFPDYNSVIAPVVWNVFLWFSVFLCVRAWVWGCACCIDN